MPDSIRSNPDSMVMRVREQLIEILEILQVGEKLPGERELAKKYGVARMTLRSAIESLIVDGYLERRPGSGTYARRPIVAAEFRLASFSEEMRRRGIKPSSRVLSFRRAKANQQVAKKLEIPVGTGVFSCVRLRLADEQSIALETLTLPISYLPDLEESDFAGSLYEAFQEKYQVRIIEAKSTISAIKPSRESANLLGISRENPCLHIDMVDKDQFGRLLMYARCTYRGDRYEVRLDATTKPISGGEKLQNSSITKYKGVS